MITVVVLFVAVAGLAGWLTFLVGQGLDRAGQWTTVGGSGVEPGQDLGGQVGDPAGDRGKRTHPAQYGRCAQGQHHRDRVVRPCARRPSDTAANRRSSSGPSTAAEDSSTQRSASSSEPELEPASTVAYDSAMAG